MKQTERKKQLSAGYRTQLGMSVGSATHKLTRRLLFGYIQRNHEDTCYRCGLKIETFETFSIEHKEPWLHAGAALFWDLSNIAFSHKVCNISAARHVGKRIIGPEGTSWCSAHRQFLPIGAFSKNRTTWIGLHRTCKECHKKRREVLADVA